MTATDDPHPDRPPAWLMRQLQSVPYLEVRTGTDALLELSVAGGPPISFVVEAKSRIGRSEAARLAGSSAPRVQDHSRPVPTLRVNGRKVHRLVATSRLVEATRDLFRAGGVSWAERDTGRCCLVGRGLLVDATLTPESRPRHGDRPWTATLAGRTGTYAETLLLEYLSGPVKLSESADRAGVSPAIASRVLVRLEEEHLVRTDGRGPATRRFLTNPDGLLDLWAAEERRAPDRVTGLYAWSSSPQKLYAKLSRLSNGPYKWALGGLAAANVYSPTLTNPPAPEIWIEADVAPEMVANVLEGELTSDAPNLFVRQTRGDPALHHAQAAEPAVEDRFGPIRLVSRLRAYVETASLSGRATDVAANLRETLLF